jgi:glycerol-3-phosphate dehydrogenase subunit B
MITPRTAPHFAGAPKPRYDAVVVGAGLAGLTAALRLAEEGQRVAVVARGVGATHLAPATIDVLGYDGDARVERPTEALASFAERHPEHPYGRLRPDAVAESVEWLRRTFAGDYRYVGDLEENLLLPTAVGAAKPSAVVPETFAAGDLRDPAPCVFVGFRGLKDFFPAYLADNVRRAGVAARALELTRPPGPGADLNALGLARELDRPSFRAWVVRELAGRLEPDERVGFPAALGLEDAGAAWRDLERGLGRRVFEVPTLPPSVPGMRLFEHLKARLRAAGGRLVVGDPIAGGESRDGVLTAVLAESAARAVPYRARSFVLATGGFASGGLELDSRGRVRETALDLPVSDVPEPGEARFSPGYFDEHPIARAGVAVDELLRPVDAAGRAVYENVHAAGAILAGAVPWREHSGNGISLSTGYAAAAAVLAGVPALEQVR